MVETSERAWEFVRSVTGYGFEEAPEEAVEAADSAAAEERAAAAPTAKYEIDYRRFEKVGSDEEGDETNMAAAAERQAAKVLTKLNPPAKDAAAPAEPVADNTSRYFDLSQSMMMQGCAHDRSKERALYERPNDEKLRIANRFRFEGNTHFRDKEFQKAAACYLRGLVQLEYTFPDTAEEEQEFESVKLACHLNLAAAKFNLKEYSECYTQCESALKTRPGHFKARFRQGQCHLAWFEYDKAQTAFADARNLATSAQERRDCDQAIAITHKEASAAHHSFDTFYKKALHNN